MLGFAFAKLATSFSNTGDLAKIACTAAILAFTLKYARSDCTEIVRAVVWYAWAPYALARAVSRMPAFRAMNSRHLFEIRGTRGQSVIDGSNHRTGSTIRSYDRRWMHPDPLVPVMNPLLVMSIRQ
jgi:hypothetical protein